MNLETPCYSNHSQRLRYNSPDCVVTNLSGGVTFEDLATAICGNNNPKECSQLHEIYVYMNGWGYDNSCGVTSAFYCDGGASENNKFSLCAKSSIVLKSAK